MKTITISGRTTKGITVSKVNGKNGPVSVAKFTVVNDDERRGKNDTNPAHVDYYDVTAWGKLADVLSQYITKPRKVLVVGTPKVERYTDKNGNARRHFDIKANRVEFMESREPAQPLPEKTPATFTAADLPDEDIPFSETIPAAQPAAAPVQA